MNKIVFILISIFLILLACQVANSEGITLEEVLSSFEEKKLKLVEDKVSDNHIFGMKLNRIRPAAYKLDGKKILIYVFDSTKEREKGLNDFRNKTATSNVVSYNFYEVKNVLIFYVHELDRSMKVELDDEIQKALNDLNTN
ncbi:MAG TPA: hypothetical protein VNM69_11025 [Bacillus sp. (in: firmicutes)]|uniref:hypothetical protein n=1 Tax=Bacillus litorisediminis TaxID=2922713 RepID=UPI001FB02D9E|nr:hypothetical protein [Bacillus litorisediminis]HWO76411.1 hypothetical protein [Bacillus sp. (in: firmicutes)]